MSDPDAGDTGFDMDKAVASVADGLGLGEPTEEPAQGDLLESPDNAAAVGDDPTPPVSSSPEDAAPAAAAPRPPPKSWAKEYHEDWAALTPKQQEYIEKREKDFLDGTEQYRGEATFAKEFKDLIQPYKPMLAAMGIDEKQAVGYLLNAQYRLTSGSPEQRAAAYRQIGMELGVVQEDPNAAPMDPALKQLRDELNGVKSALTQRQEADLKAAKADAQTRVDKFASDPANIYFDEVATDMIPFINAGLPLQDAYDRAVGANPVTREKEFQRRLTDEAAKQKEKTRAEGEAAKKATAHNVRGVESRKAPTEPKGTMEDTMRSTLKELRGRAH